MWTYFRVCSIKCGGAKSVFSSNAGRYFLSLFIAKQGQRVTVTLPMVLQALYTIDIINWSSHKGKTVAELLVFKLSSMIKCAELLEKAAGM